MANPEDTVGPQLTPLIYRFFFFFFFFFFLGNEINWRISINNPKFDCNYTRKIH
jgi:hypothetical protein